MTAHLTINSRLFFRLTPAPSSSLHQVLDLREILAYLEPLLSLYS
jgi:hypothetical protein